MAKHSPSRYFKTNPEVIRLAVMLYVRFPLSLRNVEDLLRERGVGARLIRPALNRSSLSMTRSANTTTGGPALRMYIRPASLR